VTRLAAVVVAGLATGAVALAGPAAADSWETTPPTTPFAPAATPADKADVVVKNLQSSNYRVILNKFGNAALSDCTVLSVTPGQQIVTPVTSGAKGLAQVVQFTTIYVAVDCTKHGH
jgi:hypothetical protein